MNFAGQTILAPLTKGGNLPFRRLCVEFGAQVTMSEMAYARQVARGSRSERALLRSHPSETAFGVQLAAGKPDEAERAAKAAIEQGAKFIDINAGCPIHDTVRRGMGATLLKRPDALLKIVERLVSTVEVPVTVKLRSGWNERETTAIDLAIRLEAAGVHALTLHPRSREQRYTKAADWSLVAELVAAVAIPVIGNGDVLTWFEERDRRKASGCVAVMLARGALIKPWLFREVRDQTSWEPSAEERFAIYYRLGTFMKEHFYDDEKGRERAMRFFPWHFGFLCRYRPMPVADFEAASREHPLMQTRIEVEPDLAPLERLLRDPREETHAQLAALLWDAADHDGALEAAAHLADALPAPDAGGYRDVRTSSG